MEELTQLLSHTENLMENTFNAFKAKLETLNAGRANPNLLNSVKIEAYGSVSMLNHVANISTQDPRTLIINVWDKALVSSVDSAIRAANLGFNPVVDGTTLKIHIPQPTEERRKELCKMAFHYAEDAKTAQKKTHRREALDTLKSLKDQLALSEDDIHLQSKKIEQITHKWVNNIDELLKKKTVELTKI